MNIKSIAVLGIVTLFSVGAVAGCSSDTGTETAPETSVSTPATSPAESSAPAESTTSAEPSAVVEGPAPTCSYLGVDRLDKMEVEVVFTNPLGTVQSLEVPYALLDGDGGIRFFTGTAGEYDDDTMFSSDNDQFRIASRTREKLPSDIDEATITCSVLAIDDGTSSIGGFAPAADSDTCEVLGTDSTGHVEASLTVTSPYTETTGVQTWWSFAGPEGVRFGGDTEVVDLVGAGETFKIIPDVNMVEVPAWVGDGEITCTVGGFWDHGE